MKIYMNMFTSTISKLYSMLKSTKNPKEVDSNKWLKDIGIKCFIDIGAFHGEYIDFSQKMFGDIQVYAFEPVNDSYKTLENKYEKEKGIHLYNYALGNKNTNGKIYVSAYEPSSSILRMGRVHKLNFPHTAGSYSQKVIIKKLDTVFSRVSLPKPIWIKIDTQGYETEIIKGGGKTLKKATLLLIEVSFKKLYVGQGLFDETYLKLKKIGFQLVGFKNQIYSPIDGTILQAHAYFMKV